MFHKHVLFFFGLSFCPVTSIFRYVGCCKTLYFITYYSRNDECQGKRLIDLYFLLLCILLLKRKVLIYNQAIEPVL